LDNTAIVKLNLQRLHRKNDARRQFASILFFAAIGGRCFLNLTEINGHSWTKAHGTMTADPFSVSSFTAVSASLA
jgi:hypothetical protein